MQSASWTVHTEVFEGPLDLLLYLVRREGIDLRVFPVAAITDAYLDYLGRMRELHLGVAAEYLVMAATLIWLKSLELLPRAPSALIEDEEGGEDPREALARRLREMQALGEVAEALDARVQVGREVFVRAPGEVASNDRPLYSPVDAFGLLDIYYEILHREPVVEPTIEVGHSGPDVSACVRRVIDWLDARGGTGELGPLLADLPRQVERVVTFVGVLEMARLQWVDLTQGAHLGPVTLTLREGAGLDLTLVTGELLQEAG